MAKGIWEKYQATRVNLEALIGKKITEIHRGNGGVINVATR